MSLAAPTIVWESGIATDTTWTKEGSPYLLPKGAIVNPGVTLSLSPGTIVKLSPGYFFEIEGSLVANGDATDTVSFTSIRDASLGGDTSGYVRVFSSSTEPALVTENVDGGIHIGFSDGSVLEHIVWATDSGGGRSGSAYVGTSTFAVGDPPVPYGSALEAVVSLSEIDGNCPTPVYTGSIENDFACALGFAASSSIPVARYGPSRAKAGDWDNPILFSPGSSGILSHMIVRFGGEHICSNGCTDEPLVLVRGGNVLARQSTFSDSAHAGIEVQGDGRFSAEDAIFSNEPEGIHVSGGDVSVSSSSFDGVENGIYVPSDYSGTIRASNDWWGDVSGPKNNSNLAALGAWAFPKVDFSPWLSFPPDAGATSSSVSIPHISQQQPPYRPPVIVIPGMLGSAEKDGKWVIDPILHVYDGLLSALRKNGYSASTSLFVLPYDWKKSVEETSNLFKNTINEAKAACGCASVDVIAHSMGGLVAESYAKSPEYENDIRKLVFLGTPHLGAPEAYLMTEGGELGGSLRNQLLSFLINLYAKANGARDALDYVRNGGMPSISELLPIFGYLRKRGFSQIVDYPDGYPRNEFLESLDKGPAFFASSSIDVMNILGNEPSSTISIIDVGATSSERWFDGEPTGYEYGTGDGTVPVQSALLGTDDSEISSSHLELPVSAESKAISFLTGSTSPETDYGPVPSRVLLMVMHSPADILVSDSDGKSTGFDLLAHSYKEEIPGSFYSGAENKVQFVSISDPASKNYSVTITGKGTGEYSLESALITDTGVATSSYSGTIVPNEKREFSIRNAQDFPEITTSDESGEPHQEQTVLETQNETGKDQVRHLYSQNSHAAVPARILPAATTSLPQISVRTRTPGPKRIVVRQASVQKDAKFVDATVTASVELRENTASVFDSLKRIVFLIEKVIFGLFLSMFSKPSP
ncbi:MAG TPA: hypothetical protein VFT82_04125 [Candidatus Paceibacterota bacterium]|nr:hypothetical protein [Candidatus Paceibacterota bacterium]